MYKKFHFIFEYIEGVILIQKTSKRGLVVKKYTKLKWHSKILIKKQEFKTYLNKKIERKKTFICNYWHFCKIYYLLNQKIMNQF